MFFDDEFGGMVRSMEGHDTAQICLNGHCVNSSFETQPEFNKNFCDRCGAKTVNACQQCATKILGRYYSSGIVDLTSFSVPAFCHNCGHPYPWTAANLHAAKELAEELDELSDEDRLALKRSIDDLVRDTPRTQIAIVRFKKIIPKAGKVAAEALRKLLVDIVSEAVRKQIWN